MGFFNTLGDILNFDPDLAARKKFMDTITGDSDVTDLLYVCGGICVDGPNSYKYYLPRNKKKDSD